jgi:hypothetical protein
MGEEFGVGISFSGKAELRHSGQAKRRAGIHASQDRSSELVKNISGLFCTHIDAITVRGMDSGSAPLKRLVRNDE